jgi:hypothetical protein
MRFLVFESVQVGACSFYEITGILEAVERVLGSIQLIEHLKATV